ncbi:PP2C family protein-serine/threonine phosphatase [Conexibacter sp. CPCC 206217]|uniref:PP2C family protein-serine/threonine phosphatase n=1 Tax=Conexibacter sp. CPCC 206217 TaxID=3064574 RepID=UPI002715CBCD|nr:SpoIIE family protein phosphatase [Conexibacter sp. CPCC 206217]MDO8209901.1 SpoIIE family protein phosphatase [Conexibacter sp. CPCC 206217]
MNDETRGPGVRAGVDAAATMPATFPLQLLLVEDDLGDAVLVQELLADAAPHLQVVHVGTVREAEELLPGGLDCLLLDLGLPDAIGLEPVERLRRAAPDAAIVVLTGHDDEHRGIEALSTGAQDYLSKSGVDGSMLARAIRYAIERRRLERSQQELLEARLEARENARLERGLLPTAILSDKRIALSTGYRPGRRRALLGGDFYDAIELDDGTLHVLIGDVSGHGPDEAALGACLRIAWRTLTLARQSPEVALARLQEMLVHERHAPDMFATLCVLVAAPDRASGRIFLAGHPPPVLADARGVRLLDVEQVSPPLGFVDPGGWLGNAVEFSGDWTLLLYTDGLIEGRIGRGAERLGPERLVELLERGGLSRVPGGEDPAPMLDELVAEVETLHGGELTDDLAMVLVTARRSAT